MLLVSCRLLFTVFSCVDFIYLYAYLNIYIYMYTCWRCPKWRNESYEGSGVKVLRVAERAGVV